MICCCTVKGKPRDARLNGRSHIRGRDLDDPVHAGEVEANAPAYRNDVPFEARASAEWRNRHGEFVGDG
jgi:hypothetical protein